MATVDQMRVSISDAYGNSPSWVDRVRRMGDSQVIAIFYNLQRSGKLNKKKPAAKKETYRQMTIFDYDMSIN